MPGLSLRLFPERFAVVRLDAGALVPSWAQGGPFWSLTRTAAELSVVCRESQVPPQQAAEREFRLFEFLGPLPFSAVGVLASVVEPLAKARISILALSTYDTDYLLVRDTHLAQACQVLAEAGHQLLDV
ncbi:MAG TPA: ACT domain-containing protein [Thermoanaerobaculia bacterium]|nr:ACT domain-containing protein [Thermoanaerobaculia bacterium]